MIDRIDACRRLKIGIWPIGMLVLLVFWTGLTAGSNAEEEASQADAAAADTEADNNSSTD